jgi:hypothetical protein
MPYAGVAWQVLHHLEGFRRLGHEVLYLEDTQRWPYDPVADSVCDDVRPAISYVAALMARCGLERAWAYRDVATGDVYGLSERELATALRAADVLVNLSGVMVLRAEHLRVPVRVYLETDPVLPQIEVAQGQQFTIDFLNAHTHHFTYGANIGAPDCAVPDTPYSFRPTRPPVIIDWWSGASEHRTLAGRAFTTIANWRQTSKDVAWKGRVLSWSKHGQFLRFIDLPARVSSPLELALAIDDEGAVEVLRQAGWQVRAASPLSKDVDAYRRYIGGSAGEFSVAKEQYVAPRSGWFSDRTATYLAAGRPAIVQDTGFGCALPTGEGLLPFSTMEEAVSAFEAIQGDYPRHSRAARAIAEDYLRAETLLGELLEALELQPACAY